MGSDDDDDDWSKKMEKDIFPPQANFPLTHTYLVRTSSRRRGENQGHPSAYQQEELSFPFHPVDTTFLRFSSSLSFVAWGQPLKKVPFAPACPI